ncbi:MAG TPA: MEKHLA domain-containing protein, partial [Hyphomicrobiales bacterium]|nr:MEKHLA domain-containing protein [Hyphomicrobiales bacterium]
RSYQRLLGRPLLPAAADARAQARALYDADFAVVSHGTEDDPIFNYANCYAQRQFEMDWATFVQLPSRLSVEAANHEQRARLMARVLAQGYIDDYSGVRLAASGRRFIISGAVVWNLHDEAGNYRGQAATFHV